MEWITQCLRLRQAIILSPFLKSTLSGKILPFPDKPRTP